MSKILMKIDRKRIFLSSYLFNPQLCGKSKHITRKVVDFSFEVDNLRKNEKRFEKSWCIFLRTMSFLYSTVFWRTVHRKLFPKLTHTASVFYLCHLYQERGMHNSFNSKPVVVLVVQSLKKKMISEKHNNDFYKMMMYCTVLTMLLYSC
jgi:hypothetical protein